MSSIHNDDPNPNQEPTHEADVPPDPIFVIHRAAMREMDEPRDGAEPTPVSYILLCFAALMWGGWYIGTYAGTWSADGLAERATAGAAPTGYATPGSSRSPYYGWEAGASAGTRTFSQHYMDLGRNQIVMGVGVTQRPTCVVGSTISDPYVGPRYDVDQIGGGQFELVAQVSSDSETAGGALPDVQTVRRTLPAPISYTRTVGTAAVPY